MDPTLRRHDSSQPPLTLITGGTRGIGAATAHRLAAAGHDLLLGYVRDSSTAEECRRSIEATGRRCVVVRADLTEPSQIESLFEVARELGSLTGVVNNAGATLHIAPLAETPVDVIRATVELNLTAALLVARQAVRVLGTSYGGRGGVLVNVGSGAATTGSPNEYVQYAAAKAGVDALTLGLAQEAADDGVRVVSVAPGIVRTDIHRDAGDPDRLKRIGSRTPLGRPGEPDEIAAAICWLLSDEASYVTGTTLRVAGGR